MTDRPRIELHHAGIWATDYDGLVAFYRRVFSFHVSDEGRYPDGKRLIFLTMDPGAHHRFVIGEGRPAGSPSTVNQISFRVDSLAAVRHYWRAVKAEGVERIVTITHGNAWSVYFWDPEGNRIEVFADTPWHTPQPCGEPIDLEQSDEEIIRFTEALVGANPQTRPFDDWRRDMAKTLGFEVWPGKS
jgi:catechol 2,3-dioxygenase-like lactoylglutathione lyase family enzyme